MAHSNAIHLLDGAAETQGVVITEVVAKLEAAAAEVRAALAKASLWRQQPRSCK